jgi:hypothetical protein
MDSSNPDIFPRARLDLTFSFEGIYAQGVQLPSPSRSSVIAGGSKQKDRAHDRPVGGSKYPEGHRAAKAREVEAGFSESVLSGYGINGYGKRD